MIAPVGWGERWRSSHDVLVAGYWDGRSGLFRTMPGAWAALRWRKQAGAWHYWWQAHALDALVDAVAAGDAAAGDLVRAHLQGILRRTGGDITANDYYDDLAWMGLATLRAHRLGLLDAQVPMALAEAVLGGHDPELGGFRWRVGSALHNVAASAPAAMLLAGTSDLARDPRRLDLARDTAQWLHTHLVSASGVVLDGCRVRDGALVPGGRVWSYNVGVVAGLDVVLAATEGGATARARLERAARVVRAGTSVLRGPAGGLDPASGGRAGVWRDEPGPDGHLFRGILARYATALVLADPDRTADIAADVLVQAQAAFDARDERGRYPASWVGAAQGQPSLAAHLSGVFAVSSAARLERLATSADGPVRDGGAVDHAFRRRHLADEADPIRGHLERGER